MKPFLLMKHSTASKEPGMQMLYGYIVTARGSDDPDAVENAVSPLDLSLINGCYSVENGCCRVTDAMTQRITYEEQRFLCRRKSKKLKCMS